ncbi:MAG: flippase [Candidatus Micrarchaeota archaeon]
MEISTHAKEVAKGSVWGLIGNLTVKFSSFLYTILIARAASQGDVGIYYLCLSIITIVTIFSDLGICGSITRYLPFFEGKGQKAKIKWLIDLGFKVIFVMGFLVSVFIFLTADLIGDFYKNPTLPEALRIFSSFFIIHNVFRFYLSLLVGKADMKNSQVLSNVQNFGKFIFTLLLFYMFGASPLTLIAAYILSHAAAVLFLFPRITKLVNEFSGASGGVSTTEFVNDVLPLGIMITALGSLVLILSSSDRLIMGILMDPTKVNELIAIYSLAASLAVSLGIFYGSVTGIFMPVISRLMGKGDFKEVNSVMQTAQRWSLFITIPFAIIFIAFSSDMLRIFYGASYQSGWLVLAIFSVGVLISAIPAVISSALIANRRVDIELLIAAFVAVVNIVLSFALIPSLGIAGAALATMIGMSIGAILQLYYGKKIFNFTSPIEIYKLLLAGFFVLLMAIIVNPIIANFVADLTISFPEGILSQYGNKVVYLGYLGILSALAGILFVAFSLLLKCFHAEDISLMKSAMRRIKVPQSFIDFSTKIASYGVKM